MDFGATRSALRRTRSVALTLLVCATLSQAGLARAQVGPVVHDGYLEYQFRLKRVDSAPGSDQHLATWRGRATTFVWKPYILLLDGSLGLTRTRNTSSKASEAGSIVTGALAASLFSRSTFPFKVYFESRDSRVDGDVYDADFTTRNWGFLQQLASRRNGGRISLEYRRSDNDDISVNGRTERRKFGSELWQLIGQQAYDRNDFKLLTSLRKLNRDFPAQTQDRLLLNLGHRFRGGATFNVEDRLYFSDERINSLGGEHQRKFLQFSGYSRWQPEMAKRLLVTGRLVAQGVESGNGTTRGRQRYVVSSSATYQYSPQVTFSGSAGVDGSNGDDLDSQTGTFQRLRGAYRSRPRALGTMQYDWGGALDLANQLLQGDHDVRVQSFGASFNQGLARFTYLKSGAQLQFGLTQTAAAVANTQDMQEQSLTHNAYVTVSRQSGRGSGYLRFSASDRRRFGFRPDEFQLFSLQASSRMQIDNTRSLNGSISLQYTDSEIAMMMSGDTSDLAMSDRSSFSYSVVLSYSDAELFSVRNLRFLSQLRYLSSDFRSDDVFDNNERLFDPDRSDSSWRNDLTYRVGLLELRLLAELRDINGRWTSQAFFSVRRYYGTS